MSYQKFDENNEVITQSRKITFNPGKKLKADFFGGSTVVVLADGTGLVPPIGGRLEISL